jgi:hypothetical protein
MFPSKRPTPHLRFARQLRCYLGWHRWQKRRGDDGAMYYECRDCGKGQGPYYPPPGGGFINPP